MPAKSFGHEVNGQGKGQKHTEEAKEGLISVLYHHNHDNGQHNK
ncbi:hypothetical protein [Paenibacillus sp. MMO-177]